MSKLDVTQISIEELQHTTSRSEDEIWSVYVGFVRGDFVDIDNQLSFRKYVYISDAEADKMRSLLNMSTIIGCAGQKIANAYKELDPRVVFYQFIDKPLVWIHNITPVFTEPFSGMVDYIVELGYHSMVQRVTQPKLRSTKVRLNASEMSVLRLVLREEKVATCIGKFVPITYTDKRRPPVADLFHDFVHQELLARI
jgi:hypothetical protein